jgi:hypothetical protein
MNKLLLFQQFIGFFSLHINLNVYTTGLRLTFVHHIHTCCTVGAKWLFSRFDHVKHKAKDIPMEIIDLFPTFSVDDAMRIG